MRAGTVGVMQPKRYRKRCEQQIGMSIQDNFAPLLRNCAQLAAAEENTDKRTVRARLLGPLRLMMAGMSASTAGHPLSAAEVAERAHHLLFDRHFQRTLRMLAVAEPCAESALL